MANNNYVCKRLLIMLYSIENRPQYKKTENSDNFAIG